MIRRYKSRGMNGVPESSVGGSCHNEKMQESRCCCCCCCCWTLSLDSTRHRCFAGDSLTLRQSRSHSLPRPLTPSQQPCWAKPGYFRSLADPILGCSSPIHTQTHSHTSIFGVRVELPLSCDESSPSSRIGGSFQFSS